MVRYILVWLLLYTAASCQNTQSSSTAISKPHPRVFVTESDSWETRGSAGGSNGTFGAYMTGGARPQTAEIIKTFGERCPDVTINNNASVADYTVVLEHEGGKGYLRKRNKVAVFNKLGDSIFSGSTRAVGSSVQDSCEAILSDWTANAGKHNSQVMSQVAPPVATPGLALVSSDKAKLSVGSTPAGADIEVDGNFMGNTPSALELTAGEHVIIIKKSGFKNWERKIKLSGGDVNVNADLEKNQ